MQSQIKAGKLYLCTDKTTCQHNSDTNFELQTSTFIPIGGILELVNRALVDGIPLLTCRRKRGKWTKRNEEKQNSSAKDRHT